MSIKYDFDPGFPVYSPSQTALFLECQMAWAMRYQRKVESKVYDHREIAGAVGTAFSVYQEYLPGGAKTAAELAHENLEFQLREMASKRTVVSRAVGYLESAHERLEKFVKIFNRTPVIPASWTLFDREAEFTNFGRCRIDAMYRTSVDMLGVLDYKTRGRLQANQMEKARREFATSNQLYHYAWAASLIYGEPVHFVSICIVIMEPKPKIDLWQFKIKQGTLDVWLRGRKQTWQDIKDAYAGKRFPQMASEHENKYGRCQYYSACFDAQFDTEQIKEDWKER